MKDPEFKEMMGHRKSDDDGFTYVYGAIKDGSTVRPATATTKRQIRNDKRSVKARALRRIFQDEAL